MKLILNKILLIIVISIACSSCTVYRNKLTYDELLTNYESLHDVEIGDAALIRTSDKRIVCRISEVHEDSLVVRKRWNLGRNLIRYLVHEKYTTVNFVEIELIKYEVDPTKTVVKSVAVVGGTYVVLYWGTVAILYMAW